MRRRGTCFERNCNRVEYTSGARLEKNLEEERVFGGKKFGNGIIKNQSSKYIFAPTDFVKFINPTRSKYFEAASGKMFKIIF